MILPDSRHHPVLRGLFFGLLAVTLTTLGAGLLYYSLDAFGDLHQIAPLSPTPAGSVTTGPVVVEGTAKTHEKPVRAGVTETPSVITRFVQQSRIRDDGDTEWVTQSETVHTERFVVRDDSGEVLVDPGDDPTLSARTHLQDGRSSRQRYFEHRIEPGDQVVVSGVARRSSDDPDAPTVVDLDPRPNLDASLQPFVTNEGLWPVRASRLDERDIVGFGFGLLLVIGGVLVLLRAFRVHDSTTAVVAMTAGAGLALVWVSLDAAAQSVELRHDLTEEIAAHTQRHFDQTVDDSGLEDAPAWDDDSLEARLDRLEPETADRLLELREATAATIARVDDDLSRFPYRLFYGTDDHPSFSPPPVDEVPRLDEGAPPPFIDHLSVRTSIALLFVLAVAVATARTGLRRIQSKRRVEQIPTTDAAGLTYGLNALNTGFRADELLYAPMTNTPCIWYEHRYKQGDDTKTRSQWVESFRIDDGTDVVEVRPGPAEALGHRTAADGLDERECCIPFDADSLYLLGPATIDPETHDKLVVRPEPGADSDDNPFLISNLPEDELQFRIGRDGIVALGTSIWATALLGFAATIFVLGQFEITNLMYATVLSGAFLLMCLAVMVYNDLVFLEHRVDRAWANIEVALKKRFDVVESLVPLVEQFTKVDRQIAERLAELRAGFDETDQALDVGDARRLAATEDQLTARLHALAESHPELEADKQFGELMETLSDLEDDVALMRTGYDEAVERYNTKIRHIPEILVAWPAGKTPREYFGDRKS